jgi:ATP-dependent Clp protease ATP-binding subunit ClpC
MQGRVVSFKNALLVLTSNIGSRLISATSKRLGQVESELVPAYRMESSANGEEKGSSKWWEGDSSAPPSEDVDPHEAYRRQQLCDSVLAEVKRFFRPEMINR